MRYWLRYKLFRFPLWTWLSHRLERNVPTDIGFGRFRGPDENIVSLLGDANADAADFDPPVVVIKTKREDL